RVIGTQTSPRPYFVIKLTASGVTFSAAIKKSPSFSRSSSSTTMTMRPFLISSIADSILSSVMLSDITVQIYLIFFIWVDIRYSAFFKAALHTAVHLCHDRLLINSCHLSNNSTGGYNFVPFLH